MMRRAIRVLAVLVVLAPLLAGQAVLRLEAQQIPTPEEFAGFRMGTDKKLVRWEKIVAYLELVDRLSDRVEVRELGKTTLGNPMILATISSPANLARQAELKSIQRRLAHPYDLGEAEAQELIRRGKVVVFIQCNIHSTEIGSSQMVLEVVHRLATENSPFVANILDNVVFLLLPSANPDGQIMVVDWYNKNVGTEYELSSMPWLYHHYVGHDNNRDAFMLTQVESRLITRVLYEEWFPQVFLDEHQMGSSGPRIFVPPFMNPINPNVDPLIWAQVGWLGFALNTALNEQGYTGVIYDSIYTAWWQGGFRATGWWHNITSLLTEVASARIASPIEQERTEPWKQLPPLEQQPGEEADPRKPLPAPRDTVPRSNYPRPWLGGTWRLRDIMDYELAVTYALLDACANGRVRLMENHYRMGRKAIEAGKAGNLYAWVFPRDQHDPATLVKMLETLKRGGVDVHLADMAFTADGKEYPAGTFIILMAQAYRAYAKDLLEKQEHPDPSRYEAGRMRDRPYDVTGWTLPLQMGVKAVEIQKPFEAELTKLASIPPATGGLRRTHRPIRNPYGYLVRPEPNNKVIATNRLLKAGAEVYWLTDAVEVGGRRYPEGTLLVRAGTVRDLRAPVEELVTQLGLDAAEVERPPQAKALRLRRPRIGLYQPWTANMDEGWTRWLLEQYEFPYTTLHNADLRAGPEASGLAENFDVIIFPDMSYRQILRGRQGEWVRPEYRGGLASADSAEEGVAAVREFVRAGGTLVLLGDSAEFALETMPMPVKNALKGVRASEFSCPGSLLRILVDNRHPVAYGMPAEATASFVDSPAFDLAPGFSYTGVKVIARYPTTNALQSGWLRGPEYLYDRIAAAEVSYEKGRIVFLGFQAQFRAQPHNTFKLLFNALHYAAATPSALPPR